MPADPSFAHRPSRALHLAAAIDGPQPYETAAVLVESARLAESGALDFVTAGPLDLLARAAPATDRIGVVAAGAIAGGPARVAAAVAALDRASRGRAGWTLTATGAGPVGAGRSGAGPAGDEGGGGERAAAAWCAAGDFAQAVARLWNGGGAQPAPPAGRPVTVVDATDPAARGAAARHADIAFVRAAGQQEAGRIRAELRRLAAESGRDPDRLRVFVDLTVDLGGGERGPEPGAEVALVPDADGRGLFRGGPVDLAGLIAEWQRSGAADGFHVRPVRLPRDLERFVNGTTALLQHRGLFRSFHPGATLREHLGLHRPAPTSPPLPGRPAGRLTGCPPRPSVRADRSAECPG